ncbi:uncharacterized protein LOC114329687 [Diabrotica virgifera virgifera]|uniref:Uncharacterized protein LOC114329687 n=1 Tax=Diabrotica virgifera virgifera TaxID=50390 RepID=A0A6P7FF79_DIAVI|nr:uncharacterized protein LOC114329687 [Diabrotica virgifera virgifera]
MGSATIGVSVLILCVFEFATVFAVSKCWACKDQSCNDPFNSKNALIQNCTNFNSYRSTDVEGINGGGDSLFNKYSTLYSSDTDFVCTKYVVDSKLASNYTFTVRTCSPRTINGQNTCEAVRQSIGALVGTVLSCQTCDGDLCNSAPRWSFSAFLVTVFYLFGSLLR